MIQAVKISSVKFAWKVLSQTLLWMETSLLLARITRHLPPTHQLVTPSIGSVCGAVQDTCNLECHRTALAWSHYDSKSQSLSILFGLFYRLLYSRVWCLYESRDFTLSTPKSRQAIWSQALLIALIGASVISSSDVVECLTRTPSLSRRLIRSQ